MKGDGWRLTVKREREAEIYGEERKKKERKGVTNVSSKTVILPRS